MLPANIDTVWSGLFSAGDSPLGLPWLSGLQVCSGFLGFYMVTSPCELVQPYASTYTPTHPLLFIGSYPNVHLFMYMMFFAFVSLCIDSCTLQQALTIPWGSQCFGETCRKGHWALALKAFSTRPTPIHYGHVQYLCQSQSMILLSFVCIKVC